MRLRTILLVTWVDNRILVLRYGYMIDVVSRLRFGLLCGVMVNLREEGLGSEIARII